MDMKLTRLKLIKLARELGEPVPDMPYFNIPVAVSRQLIGENVPGTSGQIQGQRTSAIRENLPSGENGIVPETQTQ